MTPQNRLQLIADATVRLLMVNPQIIVEYAYKVVANPDAYPSDVVARAQAVVEEEAERTRANADHRTPPAQPAPHRAR